MTRDTPADGTARAESAPSGRVVERRSEPRYPAPAIGFRSRQIQATLIDLSRDGLAIESLEHPPIGETLRFSLERGKARAKADGEVCWCNLERTFRTAGGEVVPVYRAGIRIGPRRPEMLAAISRAARLDWVAGNS